MRYLVTFKDSAWQQIVFASDKKKARAQIMPWAKSTGHVIDSIIEF